MPENLVLFKIIKYIEIYWNIECFKKREEEKNHALIAIYGAKYLTFAKK